MKNLKKVLALALTFAMAISMFASAAFTDAASISPDHADDVAMLVELGVLGGYEDGSFKPQNTITRAEFSKMAYTVKYGKDDAGKLFAGSTSIFKDVEGNADVAWAKGYINYCSNQGIVGGVGGNMFNPKGNITVAQVAKMLLVILGANAEIEGYGGSNWMGNVVADAMELGVFDGWVGDPTEPATRELVATLMRNTIFAPVYEYNNNGVGSQKNLLGEENPTLGEKTMGLDHIEGIVVANDNVYITYDAKGKLIADECEVTVDAAAAEDEMTILVENNDGTFDLKDIEYDVDNDMIGRKVNIYTTTKNGKTTILGDVLVSADSVAYDLTAADIEIMPNGESGSTRDIVPYIAINAGEKEFQVRPRNGKTETVPANIEYDGTALLDYFYFGNSTDANTNSTGELAQLTDKDNAWYTMLGDDSIQSYRAVSLDGGKTISYIFRTATKKLAKVSTYSEANDTIAVSGFGTISELEKNVSIEGEIAKGDQVVAYKDSGKLFIAATEEVVGKAEIVDDNEVTIAGNNYKADLGIFTDPNAVNGLANYFRTAANSDANKYITYNGYILDVDAEGMVASVDQYAAVLASSFDEDLGAVKVRLAFADETVGTYAVGKVDGYKMTRKTPISYVQFQNNAAVGNIYRYAIAADGTVNLFTDSGAIKNDITAKNTDGFDAGNITINGNKLMADDNSIVFMLYGGCAAGASASDATSYEPIEAIIYKIAELPTANASAYGYFTGSGEKESWNCAYVASNDKSMPAIIAATMPMGKTEPTVMPETDNVAYLVEAKYGYDYDNYEFFANVTMVTADGLVETKTVGNINSKIGDTGAAYGGTPKAVTGSITGEFVRGSIIAYALDANGVITALGLRATTDGGKYGMQNAIPTSGFAYATIASVTEKSIGYYAWSNAEIDTEEATVNAIKRNKYEFEVIGIDDGNFVEDAEIETTGRGDVVPAGAYNAIIQTRSGEVVRVFTMYGNI